MRVRQLILCVGLALALTACGKRQSADERSGAAASAPVPTAAATHPGVQQKTAEQASDLPSKITRMNEDGSETVEDVPGDSGAHNPLLAAVASTVAASTPTASAAMLPSSLPVRLSLDSTETCPSHLPHVSLLRP